MEGVQEDVEEDLLHLVLVDDHRRQPLGERLPHRDVVERELLSHEAQRVLENLRDVAGCRLQGPLPGEVQQVAHDLVRPHHRLFDHLQDLGPLRIAGADGPLEVVDPLQDDAQGVLDLMGDPAGELADRRHLLGVHEHRLRVLELLVGGVELGRALALRGRRGGRFGGEPPLLLFRPPALRDVADGDHRAQLVPAELDPGGEHLQHHRLTAPPVLIAPDGVGPAVQGKVDRVGVQGQRIPALFQRQEVDEPGAQHRCIRPVHEAAERRVVPLDSPLAVDPDQGVDDGAQRDFQLPQLGAKLIHPAEGRFTHPHLRLSQTKRPSLVGKEGASHPSAIQPPRRLASAKRSLWGCDFASPALRRGCPFEGDRDFCYLLLKHSI